MNTPDSCPVCGSINWKTIMTGNGIAVQICAHGCIARTYPSPPVENGAPPVDGFTDTEADALASAEFRFANRLMNRLVRFKQSGRLLDVGSGCGHVVRAALDRGFDAVGLEMTELGASYARSVLGLDPVLGSFPEYKFNAESFDVVVMKHVLEHIPNPVVALAEAYRILRPGGVILVESPNFNSLMRRVKGPEWIGLQPSQHLWQLTPSSISRMLKKTGFGSISVMKESLEYRRGIGSLPKWMILRAMVVTADILGMGDNITLVAKKSPVVSVKNLRKSCPSCPS
ncbi:MAG: class I SAM-dependent methyltransferase [Armatimonadota bacterium]